MSNRPKRKYCGKTLFHEEGFECSCLRCTKERQRFVYPDRPRNRHRHTRLHARESLRQARKRVRTWLARCGLDDDLNVARTTDRGTCSCFWCRNPRSREGAHVLPRQTVKADMAVEPI